MNNVEVVPMNPKEASKWKRKYGKQIQISRKIYDLVWCKSIKMGDIVAAGMCDSQKHKLYVDPTCDEEVMATILHEFFHAEFAESGMRQRRDWDMNVEEQIVEMLSQAIVHNYKLRAK